MCYINCTPLDHGPWVGAFGDILWFDFNLIRHFGSALHGDILRFGNASLAGKYSSGRQHGKCRQIFVYGLRKGTTPAMQSYNLQLYVLFLTEFSSFSAIIVQLSIKKESSFEVT